MAFAWRDMHYFVYKIKPMDLHHLRSQVQAGLAQVIVWVDSPDPDALARSELKAMRIEVLEQIEQREITPDMFHNLPPHVLLYHREHPNDKFCIEVHGYEVGGGPADPGNPCGDNVQGN